MFGFVKCLNKSGDALYKYFMYIILFHSPSYL